MPEASGGEKTLPASPQKKRRAREDGNIAKSQDLNSAAALLVALMAMRFLGPQIFGYMVEAGRYFFGNADLMLPERGLLRDLSISALMRVAWCVVPFMLIMMLSGLTMNFIQVGLLFTTKPITPKPDRLNPITGFKKFASLRTLVELVKSVLKLTLIGYIVWLTFRSRTNQLIVLMELTPRALVPAVAALVLTVWWRISLAMLVIGLLDYAYQRWQYERDLMMTAQEAKREAKELEGDPHVKARIRQSSGSWRCAA